MISPDENQGPAQVTVEQALQMAMRAAVSYTKTIAVRQDKDIAYAPFLLEFQNKETGEMEKGFCVAFVGPQAEELFYAINETVDQKVQPAN